MNILMLIALLLLYSTPSPALLLQRLLDQDYSLVVLQSEGHRQKRSGPYNVDLAYYADGIGLAREFALGESWKAGLGMLISDDHLQARTGRSPIEFGGRRFDLNRLLSVGARLEFSPLTPYVSLAYRYRNEHGLSFDMITALKFFQLDHGRVDLGNPLGELLRNEPEVAATLQQELTAGLPELLVYPVVDLKLSYRFN